jgi:hypothetical protein
MDEEPPSTDDDDRGSDSEDQRDAVMTFDDHGTPSEEDPKEVVPHANSDE